jgi:SAM-dependent methyltransferase
VGNATVQGDLWGTQARDWADLQEPLMLPLYAAVLDGCAPVSGARMLDVGCGSGMFCGAAQERGLVPAGIDAAEPLLAIARERFPGIRFDQGEMESLPYPDASFDLVTGNNSFQYAADPVAALREARRVMKPAGRLSIQVWGAAERCEMATYMAALGSVLPPPPPGAPGPFALSVPGALEALIERAGLVPERVADVDVVFDFADAATALRALKASGPAIRAIRHAGEPAVTEAISKAMAPFQDADGHVRYHNQFRYLIARAATPS